ncbi:hypothetical protein PGT21_035248 [Puccinia graminis f. sp. tritici]|uniref:Uncharacterized protein n=1 Tax=Puccinia graminis f. sp. tritici TaxID=56615 RepID=A0A5B0MAJ8_PUCGR|nr:hypothetical protein PGTUg99_024381 [Puccinia graminis f. sp. tritici]KAA1084769.1 hypothetical protein PGT21_035248 [Puccinia graminis f. sp. tritici]
MMKLLAEMMTTRLSLSEPRLNNPFEPSGTSDEGMSDGASRMPMEIDDTEQAEAISADRSTTTKTEEEMMEIDPTSGQLDRRGAGSPAGKKAPRRSTRAGSVPARPRSQHGHPFRLQRKVPQFLRGSWIHPRLQHSFAPRPPLNPLPTIIGIDQMQLEPASSTLLRGSTALRRSTRPALRHDSHITRDRAFQAR